MNPFQILGVPYDATEDQIKLAYRKLAMEHHPDRNKGSKEAEEKFKEVGEAYEKLKDPVQRQMEADRAQGKPQFRDNPFGGGFGFQHGPGGSFQFDFDDLFAGLGVQHPRARQRNADLNVSYAISLEDAFKGKEVALTIQTPGVPKHIATKIPAGIADGQRIRLAGQGDQTHAFLPPGDLYLIIRVLPHDRFSRIAQNLLAEAEISAFEALLGGELDVEGIDGQLLRVTIHPGTQPGQRFRVEGHGMPQPNGEHLRGDLVVQVHVKVPYLDESAREKLRDLLDNLG